MFYSLPTTFLLDKIYLGLPCKHWRKTKYHEFLYVNSLLRLQDKVEVYNGRKSDESWVEESWFIQSIKTSKEGS